MEPISLNGEWKLTFTQEFAGIGNDYQDFKERVTVIPAMVPGNIELDLAAAGIEPDPFYGTNLYRFRPYEFTRWWFKRDFTLPAGLEDKDVFLRLDGVDTFARITLNGKLLGQTDNMLIEHRFEISKAANFGGNNHLTVMIESTLNRSRRMEQPVGVQGVEQFDEMVLSRKPGHCFGWDIGPRLVSAGLWKDVSIEIAEKTRFTEVYLTTKEIKNNAATLFCAWRFTTPDPTLEGFSVRITGKNGMHTFTKTAASLFSGCRCDIAVENPLLWWPKGYGEPDLYDITMELLQNGKTVDRRDFAFGIRAVRLETRWLPGDDGEFKIRVNGTPIQAKGTNWVFVDALHSRDAERLDQAFELVIDANCNTLRCWGGNVYESDRFYELCDRNGLMVWQDFCFACGFYPQDDGFGKAVEKEAAAVIRRLRNHPSIILWAGDNEIDALYYHAGRRLDHARLNRISREWLPRALGLHDPYRAYIPSSPYIPEHLEGDTSVPEQHNWGPRDYFKGDFYRNSSAHFISECGYHGCPTLSTLQKFIPPQELWPFAGSEAWDTHNTDYIRAEPRSYNRNQLMADQVEVLFGPTAAHLPLERFIEASQFSQAEAKKYFIERMRLKKWRVTGLLWWNMLDGWPQISDAVVDYYFHKKLAYYYIRRSQMPVCLMMDEPQGWKMRVVAANDSRRPVEMTFSVTDENGTPLLEGQATVPAGENMELGTLTAFSGAQKLYLLRWKMDGKEYGNHYISGYPPFALADYERWLTQIEQLPGAFSGEDCFR